jgi:hypothetical protein
MKRGYGNMLAGRLNWNGTANIGNAVVSQLLHVTDFARFRKNIHRKPLLSARFRKPPLALLSKSTRSEDWSYSDQPRLTMPSVFYLRP